MKLLYCPKCSDLFALSVHGWKFCRCAAASGLLTETAGEDEAIQINGRILTLDAAALVEQLASADVVESLGREVRTTLTPRTRVEPRTRERTT